MNRSRSLAGPILLAQERTPERTVNDRNTIANTRSLFMFSSLGGSGPLREFANGIRCSDRQSVSTLDSD